MADISAKMVKDLREMTGAGMMDCKKALTETEGDMDKAVEFLREKGLAAADKKAGRIAAEGICDTIVTADGKTAAIVEVNSETDFVAKNETFREFVGAVAAMAVKTNVSNIDEFLAEPWEADSTKTVKEALSSQIAIIGENMSIRRFEKLHIENGFIESYIHGGGRIGILVEMESSVCDDAVKECAKNIAMQIAAMSPKYTTRDEVPQSYIDYEKEIIKAQIVNDPANEGKPANIIDKMLDGRMNKQLKEICLLDQVYVKDSEITVAQYLANTGKAAGITLAVKRFIRYETGEGLEKKSENFAEEVARQMGN